MSAAATFVGRKNLALSLSLSLSSIQEPETITRGLVTPLPAVEGREKVLSASHSTAATQHDRRSSWLPSRSLHPCSVRVFHLLSFPLLLPRRQCSYAEMHFNKSSAAAGLLARSSGSRKTGNTAVTRSKESSRSASRVLRIGRQYVVRG